MQEFTWVNSVTRVSVDPVSSRFSATAASHNDSCSMHAWYYSSSKLHKRRTWEDTKESTDNDDNHSSISKKHVVAEIHSCVSVTQTNSRLITLSFQLQFGFEFVRLLRRDFGRSNNLNTITFANNRDFGKLFTVKHKRVWVVFDEQVKQLRELFQLLRT